VHYDPYNRRAGGTLTRQRMDFLLLLDRHRRVVLEVDGIQHCADDDGSASTARYAEMVAADPELRLARYEAFRFGGAELSDRHQAAGMLDRFFDALLVTPDQV
jgi:very-short-patch-repair endonuclease